jgi:hypothetical protein
LQRNTEESNSAYFIAHYFQKVMDVGPFLNVVGEVKMNVIQYWFPHLRLRVGGRGQRKQKIDQSENQTADDTRAIVKTICH